MKKPSILFLCTGNSCRSQMAEAWCKHFHPHTYDVFSAGIEKHGLNPWMVKVMTEASVSMEGHLSQTVEELERKSFDYVVTVCGHAQESCPAFLGEGNLIPILFEDPPKLAQGLKDEDEILLVYRKVRDQIKEKMQSLPQYLN